MFHGKSALLGGVLIAVVMVCTTSVHVPAAFASAQGVVVDSLGRDVFSRNVKNRQRFTKQLAAYQHAIYNTLIIGRMTYASWLGPGRRTATR